MNRRVLLGRHGQRGDLFVNLPSIKYLTKINPEISFYLPINKQYVDMLPLFSNLWYLDGTFITDEYEHFPSKIDNDNCKKMKFVNVYNPMQPHKDEMWWKIMHLTQVNYFDYFGELPLEFDSQVELNKFF